MRNTQRGVAIGIASQWMLATSRGRVSRPCALAFDSQLPSNYRKIIPHIKPGICQIPRITEQSAYVEG